VTVCEWFGLKTTQMVSPGLTLKLVATVFSDLASKPVATVSPDFGSKLVTRIFRFGPKNGSSGLVIWASKSLQRFLGLGLKIKQTLVCRLRHKTNSGRTT
jgi:hypothetical protein